MYFVEEKHCFWENQAVLHVLAIKVVIVWVTFSFCAYAKLPTMKENLNRSCQWWVQLFSKLSMVKATSLLWNWKKINETKCSLAWWFSIHVWWFSIHKCHRDWLLRIGLLNTNFNKYVKIIFNSDTTFAI